MELLIKTVLENIGFSTLKVINYTKDGKRENLIAYLPKKACFVQVIGNSIVRCNTEQLILRIDGQLTEAGITHSLKYSDGFINNYGKPDDWGKFQSNYEGELNDIFEAIDMFTEHYLDYLRPQFICDNLVTWFVGRDECHQLITGLQCDNGFREDEAREINKAIVQKLPAKMFSTNTTCIV
jgi:hypothetical protein